MGSSYSSESMNKMNKALALAAAAVDNDLPDEIIAKIITKITDLKTLCKLKLISKHVHSLVLQVDTISLTLTLKSVRPYPEVPYYHSLSTKAMNKFTHLKSLSIHLPIAPICLDSSSPFFKWKLKFDHIVKSFVFISTTSVYDKTNGVYVKGNGNEVETFPSVFMKFRMACNCLEDVNTRLLMLFDYYLVNFPLLDKVAITDSVNAGVVEFSGVEIGKLRDSIPCHSERLNMRVYGHHRNISRLIVPLLELRVSGYVMKNVTLYLFERKGIPDDGDYSFLTRRFDDDDHHKLEAAYGEAMMEIMKNHRGRMEIIP